MGKLARPHHQTGTTTRSTGMSPLSEADSKIIGRVEELANNKGWTMAQVSLAWSMSKGISSPILGYSKVERIDESLGMKGKELSPDDIKYLEEEYNAKPVSGHS